MTPTLYDMHTHTDCSHDSTQPIDALCAAEIAAGITGVAVTDHSDGIYSHKNSDFDRLRRSAANCLAARRRWGGQLEILCGAEIGEELWSRENAATVRSLADWDVILASHHGRMEAEGFLSLGQQDYTVWPQQRLDAFLRGYLEDLALCADEMDYDILTHIDIPLRYICRRDGRSADLARCADVTDEILRTVIRRGKTLEVNTSGLANGWRTMPDTDLVRRYYELGGRRISLGSDAHVSQNVAYGLHDTAALLQTIGFTGQTIYRKRQPVEIPF